jgi:hypothetical protein
MQSDLLLKYRLIAFTGCVLFMILVLSYIGLMLMLCSRPLYGHLNENIFFKSIGGLEIAVYYAVIFYYDLGHCPYLATIWNPFLESPRFLMTLEN